MAPSAAILAAQNDISPPRNNPSRSALLFGNLHKPNPILTRQLGNWQWYKKNLVFDASRGYDEEEAKYFDAVGGAATVSVGYGNKRVLQVMKNQGQSLAVGNEVHWRTEVSEEFAQALVDSTGRRMTRAAIYASGSDATEAAAKLAKQYQVALGQTQRDWFISRRQSYHGATVFALSLSGHEIRRKPFENMLNPNVSFVSPCNPYRGQHDDESDDAYVKRLADELEAEFQRVGPHRVIAFIAEPVVGAALGCVPALPGYLKAMQTVCHSHGALFIADEIMCGSGRCGTLHVWEKEEGFVPDIQTMGKALTGGYTPIGALLSSRRVTEVIEHDGAFAHGLTHQGSPTVCAVGLEVLRQILELLPNVRKMGALLSSKLKQALDHHPNVGNIRGDGLFWGIEFVLNKRTKEPFEMSSNIAERLRRKALGPDYEIGFYPGTGSADGMRGDHVIIAPAYNITEEDVDYIVEKTVKVIYDFFEEL